jgi:hypothetical protein
MVYRVDPQQVLYRYLDGETVLINTSTSYYYSLNEVGSFIWGLLTEKNRTTAELLEAVQQEYAPPADVAARDLDRLLSQLKDEGLVIEEES